MNGVVIAIILVLVGSELLNIYAMHKLEQRIDELDFKLARYSARRRKHDRTEGYSKR